MSTASLLAGARARLTADGGTPLRFVLAGALNTAFGLSIYPLIRWAIPFLHTHYQIALLVAQVTSLCFAYPTYKLAVFRTRGSNIAREVGAFSGFYFIAAAVNWAALPLLVQRLGLGPNIAQTGFSVLLIISSYLWHSRITFRQNEGKR